MNEETLRDKLIRKAMKDCRHFNGIQHATCEAGVNYDALLEQEKYVLPCLSNFVHLGKRDPARCEKFETMNLEDATKDADKTLGN
jgi:hypothetical protein